MSVQMRLKGVLPWENSLCLESTNFPLQDSDITYTLQTPVTAYGRLKRSCSASSVHVQSKVVSSFSIPQLPEEQSVKRHFFQKTDLLKFILSFSGGEEYKNLSLVSKTWKQQVLSFRKYQIVLYLHRCYGESPNTRMLGSPHKVMQADIDNINSASSTDLLMRNFYVAELHACVRYIKHAKERQANPRHLSTNSSELGAPRFIAELSKALLKTGSSTSERARCQYLACSGLKMLLSGHMEIGIGLLEKVGNVFLKKWVAEEVLSFFIANKQFSGALRFINQVSLEEEKKVLLQRFFRLILKRENIQSSHAPQYHLIRVRYQNENIYLRLIARRWMVDYLGCFQRAEELFGDMKIWDDVLLGALEEFVIRAIKYGELDNALEIAVHIPISKERKRAFGIISCSIKKELRCALKKR